MAGCAPKKQAIRRVNLGDMRHKVLIRTRSLVPISDPNATNFGESFTTTYTRWAHLATTRGDSIFDGTTIKYAVTHIFTVRYIAGLTEEKWLEYQNQRYDIVDVEALDGRNLFMKLRCALRGSTAKEVNKA